MATRIYLVISVLFAAVGSAQSPRPDFCLKVDTRGVGKEFYQHRSGARYCDGITFKEHSRSGFLPLLAMATGVEGESLPEDAVGILTPSRPLGAIRLQGTALDGGVNYRLDGELSSGSYFRLGPESGLAQIAGLDMSGVGWVAWAEHESGQIYLPTLDASISADDIAMTVRPRIHSSVVLYSVADAQGQELIKQTAAEWDVKAHTNVTFSIPSRGSTPILVTIIAQGKHRDRESIGALLERRQARDEE